MELSFQSGCEADLFQPLLSYLRAKQSGTFTAPYIPQLSLRPVHQLCKIALLWKEAGFLREAGQLAYHLKPLLAFPTLWCPEKEFEPLEEMEKIFAQLKSIESIPSAPLLDVFLYQSPLFEGAFTYSGNGSSLGVIQTPRAQIRSFGPQAASLQFGIQGKGENGWARCLAFPEIWLEMKVDWKETACRLDFRFVGLKPEMPLSMAFYLKGTQCQIGNEIFKPKSLKRFQNEADSVLCDNLKIESSFKQGIQLIPLAGEGCFWDAEFLLTFSLPPFLSTHSFTIVAK